MKTSSCKAKGRRLSQKVKEMLLSKAPSLVEDDIVVVPSGVNGPDLHLSPLAKSIYPLAIECKNQESLNIWAALKQSREHAVGKNTKPIVMFSRNREQFIYVALTLEDFLSLLIKQQ
jgi:hypothetical protein